MYTKKFISRCNENERNSACFVGKVPHQYLGVSDLYLLRNICVLGYTVSSKVPSELVKTYSRKCRDRIGDG